jgi:hypothetical protein
MSASAIAQKSSKFSSLALFSPSIPRLRLTFAPLRLGVSDLGFSRQAAGGAKKFDMLWA